jgi:hypothetical protein
LVIEFGIGVNEVTFRKIPVLMLAEVVENVVVFS